MPEFDPKKLEFLIEEIETNSKKEQPAPAPVQADTFIPVEEEDAVEVEKAPKVKKAKKGGLSWYTKLLIFVDVCAVICFAVAYGPWAGFRDWLVSTALSTTNHRYFAYILYSEDMVQKSADKNAFFEPDSQSDMDAIVFDNNTRKDVYSSEYEKQVLEREEGTLYKIIDLDEDKYKGWVTVIYEPSRLYLEMAKGSKGDTITQFAARTGALIATNAGGAKRYSSGVLYTKNNIIVNGEAIKNNHEKSQIIGVSWEGKLMLVNETADEAIAEGMKFGVQFGPFLIVNGESTKFIGNGGYGIHPRTAIGQRKDGILLLVTIDGRGASGSSGISLPDLTSIFERYDCYNAANLDGGGSTMLAVNGKLWNNPRGYNYTGERYVYNAIIYK